MYFERTLTLVAAIAALCISAAGIGTAAAAGVATHGPGMAHGAASAPEAIAPAPAEGYWTCPMHADVHEHAPGKCPVCKMRLVKTKP